MFSWIALNPNHRRICFNQQFTLWERCTDILNTKRRRSIRFFQRWVSIIFQRTVQITLNFKVNAVNADGTSEWKKYTYTTTSPLELGNRFPLVQVTSWMPIRSFFAQNVKNFDLEGEMFVDCLDKELRPFCISESNKSLEATAG